MLEDMSNTCHVQEGTGPDVANTCFNKHEFEVASLYQALKHKNPTNTERPSNKSNYLFQANGSLKILYGGINIEMINIYSLWLILKP